MSDDYPEQIQRIRKANSLEEVQAIAREYPAKATGEGGILYSRQVGEVSSETIAKELSSKTGEPIINNTDRAKFLGNKKVETAIFDKATDLFAGQGQDLALAKKSAGDFLYGNPKAVTQSATSLEGSLWGEASREFASSLHGDIKVVASNANVERVFGKVELPAVLDNTNVRTLGGQPVGELKALYAQGGADAVLPRVQAQFLEAAPKGIFISPENIGPKVTKVSISQEFAATLGADAGKLTPASELSSAGLVRAPTGFAPPSAALGEAAITGEAVGASRGLSAGTVGKGVAVVGAAALAYDFVTTGHQVVKLEAQGNATGAESAKSHFIGRNVGGIGGGIAGGCLAGAGYGLVAGSETGPGALVTAGVGGVIGGVGGAFMGEKWAQQKDIDRVFTQQDRDGNAWSRDPNNAKGTWTRLAETQQLGAGALIGSTPTYSKVRYVAGDTLANELNYKSANASYELGLANPATPQNPYSIRPGRGDTTSLDGEGNWNRNPETHQWGRTVVDQYIEHGMKVTHAELASPQRAEALDQASSLIIAQNAANAPASVAARYQVSYNQFGWDRYGELPAAVKDASTQTESLQASDGHVYTHGASGGWATPGLVYGSNEAAPLIRDELNTTYQSLHAGLQQMSAIAAEAKAHPTIPGPMSMREMVANAYKNGGIERTEAQIDAATRAVTDTHVREGLDQAGRPYTLVLQPDARTGRPGPDSAIVTMMDDGHDGLLSESRMVPRVTTTTEEIRHASAPPAAAPSEQTHELDNAIPIGNNSPRTPNDPGHPNHALLEQIRNGVRALDDRAGRPYDERSERLSHSLLAACKDNTEVYPGQSLAANAITRADHVLVGPTGNAFVVEGRLDDPAQKRAVVPVEQAMQTPVEQSDAKLQAANQFISQEQLLAQQQNLSRSQNTNASLSM